MKNITCKTGIIFDMDGTLWDSSENVAASWNLAIKESGMIDKTLTAEDIKGVMGNSMDVIADLLFDCLSKEDRMQLLDRCCGRENEYLRLHGGILYEGVKETLDQLKEKYPLFIVSNCQSGYIEAFLDYYHMWDYFTDIECYGNNKKKKGDNIRLIADRNGLGRAVYVGDIQGDYNASRDAGAGFIHAAYGFGTIHEKVPAISKFSELLRDGLQIEQIAEQRRAMTKLDELIDQINRKHVYIQTHNFPDPDAIASAYGLQALLKARGVSSTICYSGRIDRYSTAKLGELLDIRLHHIENLESVLSEEDEVILVDAQKGNSNIIDMTGDEIICIDHHPENEKYEYRFKDIRSEIGACASIIAWYFFENNIPVTRNIATALTYGIRIDTNNLSRGVSKLDIDMIYRLYDECDYDIIHVLENSTICFEDLIAYSKAIASIEVYGDISFADTGRDCPVIADISDFMLALKEVAFSVVYSRREGGFRFSVRSLKPSLDAGKIVHEALKGLGGDGGGHAEMAGGFIPFEGTDEEAERLSADIKERFITLIRSVE